jgi:cytoskeletal protein CcmA (bactofilin family)
MPYLGKQPATITAVAVDTTTGTFSGQVAAASLDISGNVDVDGVLETDGISIASTVITSTAAELNILDGVSASAADINLIDGITNGTVIASKAIITDANKDITGGRNITISGELDAATLDISGDADIDGTLEADAITVNGTALSTVIAGTTVTTATNATHVSVADNESTNEENLIPFIEDASATGNVGLESDGDFAYNPSTGTVSATVFKGNIDAVDGDFDGTLEADAITIGGTAIASVLSPVAGSSSIVTTGALNSGSITSGFGTIDTGSSTITTTGAITGGSLVVDDITIDGSTISDGGDFTLDIDGDITLDANGGQIRFKDNGTEIGVFSNVSSDFLIVSAVQDKDILFNGNDGGAAITALTLDMSDAGTAIFNHDAKITSGNIQFGASGSETGQIEINGGRLLQRSTGDASGLRFDGSAYTPFKNGSAADGTVDIGSTGARYKDLFLSSGVFLGGTGSANELDDYEEGTWTPTIFGGTTAGTYSLESARTGGKYTKIGRLVTIVAVLRISSIDSAGAGTLNFGGLPFAFGANIASAWAMGQGIQVTHYAAGTNSSADSMPPPFIAVGGASASTIELYSYGKNYQVTSNIQTLSATSWIYQIAGTYMTS